MPQPRLDAVQQAVSLLARREHSSRELRDKLRARKFSPKAIETALAILRERDLQSDHRFAGACACSLMDRGYGSLRVAGELRARGVEDEIVLEFEHSARQGDLERAREALSRRIQGRITQPGQMFRFLGQRGYPAEVARRAVDETLRGTVND